LHAIRNSELSVARRNVAAVQTPSFDFRSALTAFGSALPPVDFIT
jgi:hypothetical protein